MDYDSMAARKTMLGSGGVIVMDDQTCMVKAAMRIMRFYAHESCGWCIPAGREPPGCARSWCRFHEGGGTRDDIDLIGDIAKNMLGRTFCPLGDAAAMPTISIVEKFRQEFEDHLDGKPCPFANADHGWWFRMADLVKLTIDGRLIEAAPGTLVIDAAKAAGIEIPASAITRASPCRPPAACAGGSGENAQADDGLHASRGSGMWCARTPRRFTPPAKYMLEFC